MTTPTTPFIDGSWRSERDGREAREVLDPARAATIAEVAESTPADVEEATAAAARAFAAGDWRRLDPMQRGDALAEIARRLRERADDLAQAESLNVGKPIAQARGEVAGAAAVFDYYARLTASFEGDVLQWSGEQVTLALREPVGVVAAIVPWNYPLVIASQALAPALAAGCSVVLKPSELTPLTALALFECVEGVVPAGVANLVLGDGRVGAQLAESADVDCVMFTGSTATGSQILRAAARDVKRVELELGGKAPVVILDDAPLEPAAAHALSRVVINQGENCGAGARVLVHERIFDAFARELAAQAARVTIGDPQDESVALGPMISAAHRDKVMSYVAEVADERALFRGALPDAAPCDRGFFAPLLLAHDEPGSRLWREEVFGPVQSIVPFGDDEQAIALANDTDYGLFASIWSGDRGRALRIAQELRAGTIRVNNGVEPIQGPWGGMKRSGLGRNSGKYGIEAVTELKQIALGIA